MPKKMKLRYTSIVIRVVLALCLLILSSDFMSYSWAAGQKIAERAPDPITEKLFRDMSIIYIPHIPPPRDFKLLDLNGNMVSLSDLKGKIVFLNFWTTWCPQCRYEMPLMQNLYMHFKNKDFAMVAINLNEPAFVVKKYFKDHKLTFTALLDSINELAAPFGIRGIPTTYIIDKDGGLIGKAIGSRRWDSQASLALFERLISRNEKNINTNDEQKKSISSHFIKPDIGSCDSMADSICTA